MKIAFPPIRPASAQRRGGADRARADASANQRCDVGARLPAQHHQAVERPDVDVLQPVPALRGLVRREACERCLVDVVVVSVDVGVGVVRDVVLDPPGVAREAERTRRTSSPSGGSAAACRSTRRGSRRAARRSRSAPSRTRGLRGTRFPGRRRDGRTSASRRRAPRGRRRRPSSRRASDGLGGARVRTAHRPRLRASCRG